MQAIVRADSLGVGGAVGDVHADLLREPRRGLSRSGLGSSPMGDEIGHVLQASLGGTARCLPLAWVHARLHRSGDEVGEGVGLVHLVERAHHARAPWPLSQLAKPSREAGAARTSSGARWVMSVHSATCEGALPWFISSHSRSRVEMDSIATSRRAASASESRTPSRWNRCIRLSAQRPSSFAMFSRAASRASGRRRATGSRSPTREAASESRVAAGWGRPVKTVAAAIRSLAASVWRPMSPVSRLAQRVSSAHSMTRVSMPMDSNRAAKSWPTSVASSRSEVRQTTVRLEPGWE